MGDASDRPLAIGDRRGDYELLCPIGEGGMAAVWIARLVRKRGFEKLVALKAILPKFAEDENFQEMFFDEARIASRIEHPNVVHVHDLGEEEQNLYLVMEYIDGHALTLLRKRIKKSGGTFPLGVAVRVVADACAGLHAAHELAGDDGTPLNVVHRDVSPQNILISTLGTSKVIDFGVAKAANRVASKTSTGFVKGKVQYMAPEQALAKPVDRRADVWGAGAVLYHLVSGRYAFEADNHLELLTKFQRGDAPAPLPATVPASVSAIITRALTHDPAKRFRTADEMRLALEASGHVAAHREVGECLRANLGAETEKRRRALNAARAELDARATAAELDDDLMPTMPNARVPAVEKQMPIIVPVPRAPIDPSLVETEVTVRRPGAPALPNSKAAVQQTLPLGQAPPEILELARKSSPHVTARLLPASGPHLPAAIEAPDALSHTGYGTNPGHASSPNMLAPLESPDALSRTGYGTNAGVASGGSYGKSAPEPTRPAPAPVTNGLPGWALAAAAASGLFLALGLILIVAHREKPADAAPAPSAAVAPAPEPPAPEPTSSSALESVAPEAKGPEPAPTLAEAPSASASIEKPKPPPFNATALEDARKAALNGDAPTVRRILGPRVRSGYATPEEANLVKQACKDMHDSACVADIKRAYPVF